MLQELITLYRRVADKLDFASPAVDLLFRLWIAHVFFTSGLTKIGNWTATQYLFQNEYHVPLLSPDLAALFGTAAELGLPVFLALGLGTRAAAIATFVFNIVAWYSYPGLTEAGMREHLSWGLMLLVTIFHGPGKLSIDYLIRNRILGSMQGSTKWAH